MHGLSQRAFYRGELREETLKVVPSGGLAKVTPIFTFRITNYHNYLRRSAKGAVSDWIKFPNGPAAM